MTDTTWVKVLMDWSAQLERELPWREKSPQRSIQGMDLRDYAAADKD